MTAGPAPAPLPTARTVPSTGVAAAEYVRVKLALSPLTVSVPVVLSFLGCSCTAAAGGAVSDISCGATPTTGMLALPIESDTPSGVLPKPEPACHGARLNQES